MDYQVVIAGGGPAAHSAALALGRARRRVMICDAGEPRNRVSKHSHTFFTRDGAPPLELRRIAIEQLAIYETVEFVHGRITDVQPSSGGFRVGFDGHEPVTTRLVLAAVGMIDRHPDVPGYDELWGETVIHCPYCHGWEVRDLPWAIYLPRVEPYAALAKVRSWTDDVVVIVEEGVVLPVETERQLTAIGYTIEHGTLAALHANDGKLHTIELRGGRRIPRQVLLITPPQQQTPLVQKLGLALDDAGYVVTDASGQTSVEGIYAAGDVTTHQQQIVIAAADGVRTAMAMDAVLATSV